jgi:hypothetical protein
MPPEALLEASGALDPVLHQGLAAVVPLLDQRLANRQAVLADGRAAVGAHAGLGEARDLLGQRLGLVARLALRHHVFAQADGEAFLRRHLAPGQDDLQRPALADDARQAHRAAVDQRHAPAPAIDAEIGRLFHHPEIAPQRKLHAACDRRPGDRGDHRLVELEPAGAERPAGDVAAIGAVGLAPGNIKFAERVLGVQRGDELEVPAGAERPALAPEHRDGGLGIGVELEKGLGQRIGAVGVHGIAGFRAGMDDGPDGAVPLDTHAHVRLLTVGC